jgi:hypothetical protein
MSCFKQLDHQALRPLEGRDGRAFDGSIDGLYVSGATANHALHETPPTYLILICSHQLVVVGLVVADLGHGDAPLALSILHNAIEEFLVGVHLCKPVLHEINGFHERVNPTSMIIEEDVRACLGHLGAAWAERVNSLSQGMFALAGAIPITCLHPQI